MLTSVLLGIVGFCYWWFGVATRAESVWRTFTRPLRVILITQGALLSWAAIWSYSHPPVLSFVFIFLILVAILGVIRLGCEVFGEHG